MLILSVGMPRAGSGWQYNLIHDLVVAAGGQDARKIRDRFFLSPILTEVNCNIGTLKAKRLLPVMVPAVLGSQFVVKAHSGPTPTAEWLIAHGRMKTTYIYRDPRAALLSAYEYGQRVLKTHGRPNAFSHLKSIEEAIDFMKEYVDYWAAWTALPDVLHARYEDLLADYDGEVARLLNFLNIKPGSSSVLAAVGRYRPGQASSDHKGLHYYKGQPERFRSVLTPEQLALCNEAFGPALEKMGYDL